MTGIEIAMVGVAVAIVLSIVRIVIGPTPADRAVGADLLSFGLIAELALLGTRLGRMGTYDLVLVATLVAFLSAVSLARVMVRGRR
ncbi:pesticidal protein Cry26Aa [Aeromicrobium sp. YIM 150415]|uniref:monovalent cation/H+ antiporter complex subunit F n=1 Tax=Aeromicrobium sp. YIM 150415 TaxID=2803912 RepID=UPI001965929E|nr:monovalent cation/H+ antiporter complex subunit F [Aeromicrobium sp. YIM 150415]MBM9464724.1 pesticidal protein Cry26Aa [Aeromicrobium sp. YIM 150415]